jgi:hypothetical protein
MLMKYVLILSLLFSTPALAQVRLPTNEVGQVQYQEVVRVPNAKLPARKLMEQVRTWANSHYAPNLSTEQQYDQEHNILFIKSSFPINKQLVRYVLTIEPKFGRYRATITELIIEGNGLTVPVLGSSSTANEIAKATGTKEVDLRLAEQAAYQQADLYHQIDKDCRSTLNDLKQTLMKE